MDQKEAKRSYQAAYADAAEMVELDAAARHFWETYILSLADRNSSVEDDAQSADDMLTEWRKRWDRPRPVGD